MSAIEQQQGVETHAVIQGAATQMAANAPVVRQQPDGPGLRTGMVAEFTLIAPVVPGGAARFRENLAVAQAQADYYEGLLGTVHDLRIVFFNNDTQVLFAATYDGDLLPYVADVFAKATPWLDLMFLGVGEGYPGGHAPGVVEWVAKYQLQADLWYASNPTMTAKKTAKAQLVMQAFDALLDAASN